MRHAIVVTRPQGPASVARQTDKAKPGKKDMTMKTSLQNLTGSAPQIKGVRVVIHILDFQREEAKKPIKSRRSQDRPAALQTSNTITASTSAL